MENKTRIVKLRMTLNEYNALAQRAKAYSSISHLIRTAIDKLDDRMLINRHMLIDNLYKLYRENDARLSWTMSNINQVARHSNNLVNNNLLSQTFMENEFLPTVKETLWALQDMKGQLNSLFTLATGISTNR